MEKKTVWIASIVVALAVLFLVAERYLGFVYYPGGGYGYGYLGGGGYWGYDFATILDFYYGYQSWFDFLIFLAIFIGLARTVFEGKGAGASALYTGVGIFLSLALLIWEKETGLSLLVMFGPIIFLLLVAILVFMWYRIVLDQTGVQKLAVGTSLLAFGAFFYFVLGGYFGGYYTGGFLYTLLASLPPAVFSVLGVLFIAGGIFLTVWGVGVWIVSGGSRGG